MKVFGIRVGALAGVIIASVSIMAFATETELKVPELRLPEEILAPFIGNNENPFLNFITPPESPKSGAILLKFVSENEFIFRLLDLSNLEDPKLDEHKGQWRFVSTQTIVQGKTVPTQIVELDGVGKAFVQDQFGAGFAIVSTLILIKFEGDRWAHNGAEISLKPLKDYSEATQMKFPKMLLEE